MNDYIKEHKGSDDSQYRLLMDNYLKGKNEISTGELAENYLDHYIQKRRGTHDKILQRNLLARYMDRLLNFYN